MSHQNCSVFGCSNTYANTKNNQSYVHFYKFPSKSWENKRKEQWIRFCKRKK